MPPEDLARHSELQASSKVISPHAGYILMPFTHQFTQSSLGPAAWL